MVNYRQVLSFAIFHFGGKFPRKSEWGVWAKMFLHSLVELEIFKFLSSDGKQRSCLLRGKVWWTLEPIERKFEPNFLSVLCEFQRSLLTFS